MIALIAFLLATAGGGTGMAPITEYEPMNSGRKELTMTTTITTTSALTPAMSPTAIPIGAR